jgi:hypothetical protein
MRFVLVGISVLLASLAAWRCMAEPVSIDEQHQQQQQQLEGEHSRSKWREAAATVMDMFTGKYLYNYLCQRPTATFKAC